MYNMYSVCIFVHTHKKREGERERERERHRVRERERQKRVDAMESLHEPWAVSGRPKIWNGPRMRTLRAHQFLLPISNPMSILRDSLPRLSGLLSRN